MKKQSLLTGVILIGFGVYFLLQQYHFTLLSNFYTWPTLLIIVGSGFLVQAYWGRDYEAILPGIVLAGIGLHFHIAEKLDVWPDHAGIFLLVIGLGFLLKYVKTGNGLLQGVFFFAAAAMLLFFDKLTQWAAKYEHDTVIFTNLWPFFFLAVGISFLFFTRKK